MRLSKDIVTEICKILRAGNTEGTAALYVGIAPQTLSVWKQKHDWVRLEIDKARAGTKIALIGIISNAAKEDWKAAAWILERTWPEDYKPKTQIDLPPGQYGVVVLPELQNSIPESFLTNEVGGEKVEPD